MLWGEDDGRGVRRLRGGCRAAGEGGSLHESGCSTLRAEDRQGSSDVHLRGGWGSQRGIKNWFHQKPVFICYWVVIVTSAVMPQSRPSGRSSKVRLTLTITSPPRISARGAMAMTLAGNSALSASMKTVAD